MTPDVMSQAARQVPVVFHEAFYPRYAPDPAAEPGRMEAVVRVIKPHVRFIEARPAAPEDLARAHTPEHISNISGRPLNRVALLAAGAAIQAATIGLSEPCFGLIRPPGHHASSDSCWGFCFYNNMAIALFHLHHQGRINSALVLDIDLHYGDGTANILGRHSFVTLHNPGGHDGKAYLKQVRHLLSTCKADIIAVSAGFDDHLHDWGGTLSTEDYYEIALLVSEAARRSGGGCFGILEGGYNHRVIGEAVLAFLRGLSGQDP